MSERDEKLKILEKRLENLSKYEAAFKRELIDLRRGIAELKANKSEPTSQRPQSREFPSAPGSERPKQTPPTPKRDSDPLKTERGRQTSPPPQVLFGAGSDPPNNPGQRIKDKFAANTEQFVGTYLISVVGILITIIGVGIGTKYAIDNDLISPLFRIILGYGAGMILSAVAIALKKKYESFSAVILSGGLATLYFVTYFAYAYYGFFTQVSAFSLMAVLTVITVFAAVVYKRQIIAHIGLVGAYSVPFAVSSGSGRVAILFGYIALVNLGILAVSLKQYWRLLFYSSFGITWLIFSAWYLPRFDATEHFGIAFAAISVFYVTFYLTFLGYKLFHKQPFGIENTALVLLNSFIFYGFGYDILRSADMAGYLGLFTVFNAFIHFAIATAVKYLKLGDKNSFYFIVVLVVTFLTIAIPVQVEGNWVIVLWFAEAFFLFGVGRLKNLALFEYLSYPLLALGAAVLFMNWEGGEMMRALSSAEYRTPVLNGEFVTSIFASLTLLGIFLLNRSGDSKNQIPGDFKQALSYILGSLILLALYNTFRIEIDVFFYARELQTGIKGPDGSIEIRDPAFTHLNVLWQLNYTMIFAAIIGFCNISIRKNRYLGLAVLVTGAILLALLITLGFNSLAELRYYYLIQPIEGEYGYGLGFLFVRYATLGCAVVLIIAAYLQLRIEKLGEVVQTNILKITFELGLAFVGLIALSSELVNWFELLGIPQPLKLGLSVLWGSYAIALLILGIAKRKKHLRIFAIALFALTLGKLFLHDIANMGTIPKTVLFVSIGVMLLVASFLYNKYTKRIFGE